MEGDLEEDVPHERELRRIATKGVVALFNAIRKYQTGSIDVSRPKKLRRKIEINSYGLKSHEISESALGEDEEVGQDNDNSDDDVENEEESIDNRANLKNISKKSFMDLLKNS